MLYWSQIELNKKNNTDIRYVPKPIWGIKVGVETSGNLGIFTLVHLAISLRIIFATFEDN